MATTNSVATFNGFFKDVFAPKLRNLIPNNRLLQKGGIVSDFTKIKAGPGKLYHQPVTVQNPQGFTFASSGAGAFAISPAIPGLTVDAQVKCNQILLEDAIDFESISLAQDNKTAFGKSISHVVQRMLDSATNVLEILMFHGQIGLGTVSANNTNVLTITTATWASGVWAVLQGAKLDVYNGSTLRGSCGITSVDLDARTVTVDAAPSGTTTNDTLWFSGQKGNDMAGIDKILTNTGSLFNIDAGTYNLWKARTLSAASAQISFPLLEKLLGKCLVNGLAGDAVALVNTQAWNNLMTNEAVLKRYTSSDTSKFKNGARGVEFEGQNGTLRVVAHTMVKEASAYVLAAADWLRLGSTDWTFDVGALASEFNDEYLIDMPQNAGKKLRLYTNQSIFNEAPGRSGGMTAVVNA